MDKFSLYLIFPIFLSLGTVFLGSEGQGEGPPLVGGQCEYHRYEGRAEIISLEKTRDLQNQADDRFEAKFRFFPDREIKESFAQVEGKEILLEINRSPYLSPGQIEKYGIQKGRVFKCILKVISRGTCTPVLFDFPSLSSAEGK